MFTTFTALPMDPILGLSVAYTRDTNPDKVDLGVGVYKTDQGDTPVMSAVKAAEANRLDQETSKAYLPPVGVAAANQGMEQLLFGRDHPSLNDNRVRSVQTPGGCGALRLAAELIIKSKTNACIWVSTPTWANHIPLLGSAGLTIKEYPYYDSEQHSVNFNAMLDTLSQVPSGDIVLLHGCCHNPCGADLTREQWQQVATLAKIQGFVPFIDMAYQGFGEGLEEDAYGLRLLAESLPELLVASSCSKNFGLYRERTGTLTIQAENAEQADATLSHVNALARGIYSMPPAHGSTLVGTILQSDELHQRWSSELGQMRNRINGLRAQLAQGLNSAQSTRDFSYIQQEFGMFSFLGLSVEQVSELRERYSIYMTDSSRINVAGLNHNNLEYVVKAINSVL